jgi:multimeric flavodoxin WrbA
MKLLGICGSPVASGNTEAVLKTCLSHAEAAGEVHTEFIGLAGREIGGCLHCNWCVKKQTEEKFCSRPDGMGSIYPRILEADGLILATPVHFGRLSGLMANMVDRLRVFVHGRVYEDALRNKVGGGIAVAFVRGGGIETTLATLNSAFLILDMLVATSRQYPLGAAALSSLDGKGELPKGSPNPALFDEFGLRSGRNLVERMIEVAGRINGGEKSR